MVHLTILFITPNNYDSIDSNSMNFYYIHREMLSLYIRVVQKSINIKKRTKYQYKVHKFLK